MERDIDSEKAISKIGKYLSDKYDVNLILEAINMILWLCRNFFVLII